MTAPALPSQTPRVIQVAKAASTVPPALDVFIFCHGANRLLGSPPVQRYTLVSVETRVYSLDHDKPLRASTTRTINPKDLDSLLNEVPHATAKEMVKPGLLARQ